MSKSLIIAACLSVLGAGLATAGGKAPFPVAADGTTNVADCAKVDAAWHNECISRARPLTGKQLMAFEAPKAAVKAAAVVAPVAVVAKTPVVAKAVEAPKGFKIAKDGTTNIRDCLKARNDVRDACISRSRPLTAKQLAKFDRAQAVAMKLAAKHAPKTKAVAAVAKPIAVVKVAPAILGGKGFKIAKDGTTNIAECGNATPEYRNECISRARPVKGAEIYKAAKTKS